MEELPTARSILSGVWSPPDLDRLAFRKLTLDAEDYADSQELLETLIARGYLQHEEEWMTRPRLEPLTTEEIIIRASDPTGTRAAEEMKAVCAARLSEAHALFPAGRRPASQDVYGIDQWIVVSKRPTWAGSDDARVDLYGLRDMNIYASWRMRKGNLPRDANWRKLQAGFRSIEKRRRLELPDEAFPYKLRGMSAAYGLAHAIQSLIEADAPLDYYGRFGWGSIKNPIAPILWAATRGYIIDDGFALVFAMDQQEMTF